MAGPRGPAGAGSGPGARRLGSGARSAGELQVGVSTVTAEARGQTDLAGAPAQAVLGVQGLRDARCLEYGEVAGLKGSFRSQGRGGLGDGPGWEEGAVALWPQLYRHLPLQSGRYHGYPIDRCGLQSPPLTPSF